MNLRRRYFLVTAGLVLLSFAVLGAAFIMLTYRSAQRSNRTSLRSTAETVAETVSAEISEKELNDIALRMTFSTIARASGTDILLCDERGSVVSCSDEEINCSHIGLQLTKSVLTEMLGRSGEIKELGGLYPGSRVAAISEVKDPALKTTAGFVVASKDVTEMRSMWSRFASTFTFAAAGVLLIALLASMLLAQQQTEPLKEMAEAAERFGHGDFSQRIKEDTDRDDEVAQLARAFNKMADSLESTEQRRREFISDISHELKTPMTTISGFTDGLLDGTIPPEMSERYLTIIADESRRLSRMVTRMLEVSKLTELSTQDVLSGTFDIDETIRVALLSMEDRIKEKELNLSLELPENAVTVCGSGDAIAQVVYNLLVNAVKFSAQGGFIAVSLFKKEGKAYVSIANDCEEDISPEEQKLIFERFHKTDRSRSKDREGVGLGLHIVKTILDAHGESINVVSEGGRTEFTFTLPLAK